MIDPMMTLDDQQTLTRTVAELPDDAVLVEYGSGGSTVMFAKLLRGNQRLYTIEHNVEWFHKVKSALQVVDPEKRVSLNLRTPDADPSVWPFGHFYEETPYACADYIHATDVEIPWSRVRLALVDGFVRGSVLAMLATKLAPETPVFLHDYLDRESWYDWAVRLYDVVQVPTGSSPGYNERGTVVANTLLSLKMRSA